MNANQIISHLEDLKKEAEGHFTSDGDRKAILVDLLRTIKGGEE